MPLMLPCWPSDTGKQIVFWHCQFNMKIVWKRFIKELFISNFLRGESEGKQT